MNAHRLQLVVLLSLVACSRSALNLLDGPGLSHWARV